MTTATGPDLYSKVIAKAWADDAYKQRLSDDPSGVLADAGITVPAGVEVRVVEDTPTVVHLVVPAAPADGEISEEALGQVSGGWGMCASLCVSG
ncbi:MAG: NHLP leader peptide family RiPP precursor [Jiangellaceae bacterium]